MKLPAVARVMALLASVAASTACAVRLYTPPSGPGVPFTDAAVVWRDLTTRCAGARTFVAEVRVEGWVGASKQRFSAPLHSAFTRANDIYFEVPAPGRSFVQMAGRAEEAVLLLPRESRVLRASTREVVEALTGLRWNAVDFLDVLTGCVTLPVSDVTGVSYGETAAIELGRNSRAYVARRQGAWQLDAAMRDGLLIEYRAREGSYPSEVRVSSSELGKTPLLMTFRISQVQANIPVDDKTFVLTVPASFAPMTLDDLRSVRPLDVKRIE